MAYQFVNWTENGVEVSTSASYPFAVTSARTLVANFQEVPVLTGTYIDPTNSAGGRNGTIENPYNSYTEATIINSTTYFVKSGTTLVTLAVLNLSGRNGTIFTSYGVGDKPKIRFTNSGSYGVNMTSATNCSIVNLELYTNLSNSLLTMVEVSGTGNIISACKIHDIKQGSGDGGMAIRGGGTNLSIITNEIYNCGSDGIYLVNTTGLTLGHNHIHLINQNYGGSAKGFNSLGNGASGDGIQLDGIWDDFYVHDNIIDRSDEWTGNKYNIIFNSISGANVASTGVIEKNVFLAKKGSGLAGCIQMMNGGYGIIFRYNKFKNSDHGINISGTFVENALIHHNIFIGCDSGIGVARQAVAPVGSPKNTSIFNNVFVDSRLSDIWCEAATLTSRNNIHVLNGAGNAFNTYGANTITQSNNCYSNTKYGSAGRAANSVLGDPAFRDMPNEDFNLKLTSICRDAGIDVGLVKDFAGNLITGTDVEMGIYEY